jgi:hypothetical protein
MRQLTSAPSGAIDPATGTPRTGSFRGSVGRVDLSTLAGGTLRRIAREKRWMYLAMATDEIYVAVAIVRLGYVANAFAFVFDAKQNRMLVDRTALGPPLACDVGDTAGEGCIAMFKLGKSFLQIERQPGHATYAVDVSMKDLEIHARVDASAAPPPITAIARVPGGVVNTTEKRALLAATGELRAAGERRSLDGALAAYDYTHGLLARRTQWRWAFLLGRAKTGERVAMNLVEGFVGEAECAVWIDDALHPLGEGRFDFDAKAPLSPWRVRTDGGVDVSFAPGAMHADDTNLGIVRSRFVQPAGVYSGKICVDGRRELEIVRALGVTEDQDVLW